MANPIRSQSAPVLPARFRARPPGARLVGPDKLIVPTPRPAPKPAPEKVADKPNK